MNADTGLIRIIDSVIAKFIGVAVKLPPRLFYGGCVNHWDDPCCRKHCLYSRRQDGNRNEASTAFSPDVRLRIVLQTAYSQLFCIGFQGVNHKLHVVAEFHPQQIHALLDNRSINLGGKCLVL